MRMKSTPNWRAQLSSRHPFFLHQHVIKIFHSAFYNRLVSLRSCTFCFHELEWHNQGSFGRLGHFTPLPPPTPLPILDGKHAAAQMAPDAEGGRLEMSRTWRKRCSRQRNKGKMKQRDWESGREAAVSSLLRWWLHPHSSAPLKPSEAFAMCKPTSSLFIEQHLGSVARFFFFFIPLTLNIAHMAVPWSLKAQHFSASNSHWDQSPEMEMQRICFIGQLQTNKSKYVFWSCFCADCFLRELKWLCDINNRGVAWYQVTCLHTWT